MINIQYEIDPNIDTPSEKISSEIISSVLMEEGKTLAEILVIFTSDEILSDLKKEFFNQEHLTDVISFRMNDYIEEKVEGEIYINDLLVCSMSHGQPPGDLSLDIISTSSPNLLSV